MAESPLAWWKRQEKGVKLESLAIKRGPLGRRRFFSSSFLRSLAVALFSFFNLDLDPFFSLTNSLSFPASEPKKTTHRSTPITRLSRRPSSRASPEGTRERERQERRERDQQHFLFFSFSSVDPISPEPISRFLSFFVFSSPASSYTEKKEEESRTKST